MSRLQELSDLVRDTGARDDPIMLGSRRQVVRVLDRRGRWKTVKNRIVHFIWWDTQVEVSRGSMNKKGETGELEWFPLIRERDDSAWRPADVRQGPRHDRPTKHQRRRQR